MENKNDSKSSKLIDKSKNAVIKALKIRRGMKVFFSFGTGISTGIATYRQLYALTDTVWISLCFASLAGAATTAIMLLVLELTKRLIGRLTKLGLCIFERLKKEYKEKRNNGKQ